ncbi:uncharacterized abhydrolase domain-containing protein DDB_G0269086-like isoform X4 [Cylas formicarius]|uniref:uncharacterized abhydrolase domain-containing protein DDB_G0269086-like isoform X4 n=1 Tax=Cylas formicarius TaxID=197179 RepID=UPI002958C240|nr:uncharacterized abhydrolase domain-containing protein DDB_G0269086-like isoform X4 [Cylas formicarius]
MVYDSDFYTTRRPYRSSPAYSSYTTSYVPSRQVKILPGLGKVHVVHSYDRLVPYVGHKRLTVVTSPPKVYATRPSVLQREYDWIENKIRPWVGYSATNRYLNSDSAVRIIYMPCPTSGLTYRVFPTAPYVRNKIYKPLGLYCDYYEPIRSLYWNSSYWPLYRSVSSFEEELPSHKGQRLQRIFDDETRLIRAQTASLLRRIHDPVPRVTRLSWPLSTVSRHYDGGLPSRFSSDNYIHKILTTSPLNDRVQYTTYYTEPVRKYIGAGHLAAVSYAGERAYNRRPYVYLYENPLHSDIQLLSYYINKFKQEKAINPPDSSKAPLSPARPSRKFGAKKSEPEDEKAAEEMRKLREARAARLAFINEEEKKDHVSSKDVDEAVRAKKEKEEVRLAEERIIAEEQARQEALSKEAARKAELARQEELAAQAAAERAAEFERKAELARQEEVKRQAEIERIRREEQERARLEEEKRLEEEAKAEEERQQLLRLEEIARQAEEEKEAELVRQAEELAELARQEAELAEEGKRQEEEEERKRQEAELEELARQEAELAELERQEKELAEQARVEAELAERARQDAETARKEADLAQEEAELAELERQQAELDALEAEAKALESDLGPPPVESEVLEEEEQPPQDDEAEAARQAELDELARAEAELAELEKAQAELDALEAEAKALESDFGPPAATEDNDYDEEEPQAIAEDVPGAQSDEELE